MLWQVLKEKYLIIHATFCMMDISGLSREVNLLDLRCTLAIYQKRAVSIA